MEIAKIGRLSPAAAEAGWSGRLGTARLESCREAEKTGTSLRGLRSQ